MLGFHLAYATSLGEFLFNILRFPLALLRAVKAKIVIMPVSSSSANKFTILYGSQTGQAKAIAEEIHEFSEQHGLYSNLFCLSLTEKKFTLEKESLVVFVVSTTGEGDPPDTMCKFMRRLKKKTLPGTHLQNLHYALLALGDTNYTNFCNNGKVLDKRLLELGAQKFYSTGYADDAVGLELTVEPWIEGLWGALQNHLGLLLPESESQQDSKSTAADTSCNENRVINGDNKSSESSLDCDGKTTVQETSHTKDIAISGVSNSFNMAYTKTLQKGSQELSSKTTIAEINDPKDLVVHGENNSSHETNGKVTANTGNGVSHTTNSYNGATSNNSKLSNSDSLSSPRLADQLKQSAAPLSSSALSIPQLPPSYLELSYHPELKLDCTSLPLHNGSSFPSAVSDVSMATVVSAEKLTSENSIKTALDLELDVTGCNMSYEPGDSFGIVCPNPSAEVEELIRKLGVTEKAETPFSIQLITSTTKKGASLPDFIPQHSTIRHTLLTCLEIRTVPSKALLRVLSEHTTEPQEKRRLQELCSKQGASDYSRLIREPGLSLLDLLNAFPSCQPPFERLLELLPRLKARPYSVSSSPLENPTHLHFVFNIVEFPAVEEIRDQRHGICTGWLSDITKSLWRNKDISNKELPERFAKMALQEVPQIPVFQRKRLNFKLPNSPETPIVMIGPGTGLAPFIGFLQHRDLMQKAGGKVTHLSEAWLFFGCRHRERDYLYQDKLEYYLSTGVLSRLFLSFSRDTTDGFHGYAPPKYVQNNLRRHAVDVAKQVFEKGAVVYVCGDARNMAKDVYDTFLEIVQEYKGLGIAEARQEMMKLRDQKQYLEDIWT